MSKIVNVKKKSVTLLYLALLFPIVVAILSNFNIVDISYTIPSVLTLVAGMFILSEVGLVRMIKRGKLGEDYISIFGIIVALLGMFGAVTLLMGWTIDFLQPIQGMVNLFMGLYVVLEGFRK